MTKRIFRSLFLLATVTLLLCLTFTVGILNQRGSAADQKEIQTAWQYIAAGIEQEGISYFNTQKPLGHRITWIEKDGTVLFDSHTRADALENHKDRLEIQQALQTGAGESIRYSQTLETETYNYAKTLKDGSILRVSGEHVSLLHIITDLLPPLLFIIVVSTLLSLLLAYRLAWSVVKPINGIDLKHPEQASTYPELKPLVQKIATQNQTIRNQMTDLFHQQQRFETITDNMSEGMLILDREGKMVAYNDAASGILSISLEHKGQPVNTLSPGSNFLSVVEDALEGNHAQQLIPMFDRTYQVIGNPIKVKEEPMGAVLALLDVTEREERDKLRQEFSANVSHELKTPLTSISGFAEIMMNGLAKPEDMSRFAARIYDEAQRLILLIGDIIQLSRLEEKDLSGEIQRVDLYEIAKDIHSRLQHDAAQREIDLQLHGSSCYVQGIPHVLDEMIYNLCDNAIKYNREKGSVTLTVLPRENDVLVAVADTGIGIPYEEQERVFERFYRIDKSHSKEIGGTGLGLSIVKHGAAFHNATVQLESVPNEGTCVTLSFPQCP
ncbi:MAG: histidine kinase [Clostridia bacterium]|nr:histidine kinase [Clostridia bacterium]